MITADNITDAQIRELWRERARYEHADAMQIERAMHAIVSGRRQPMVTRARARCAEILNARAERKP